MFISTIVNRSLYALLMGVYRCDNQWGCPCPGRLFDSDSTAEYCSQECRRIAHAHLLGISIPHAEARDDRPGVVALKADRAATAQRKPLTFHDAILELSKRKAEIKPPKTIIGGEGSPTSWKA